MNLNLESLNRSELSVEIVSANTAEPLEIEETGRFAVLKCGPERVNELHAAREDEEVSVASELEEVMAPLVGAIATLKPDGSISYDFEATFAEMNCDGTFEDVTDDGPDSVFFDSDWETVEQEEVLAPFFGMIATMNTDGSILYSSHEEGTSNVSADVRQSIHHAPRTSESEQETVILAR